MPLFNALILFQVSCPREQVQLLEKLLFFTGNMLFAAEYRPCKINYPLKISAIAGFSVEILPGITPEEV